MINAKEVKYINVESVFFNVSVRNPWCSQLLLEDDDSGKAIMNHVITKPKAAGIAQKIFEKEKSEYASLKISRDSVKAKYITDYFGDKIFPFLDGNISGWLIFFDAVPYANWAHPCNYLFVIDDDNYELVDSERGLSGKIQLDCIV